MDTAINFDKYQSVLNKTYFKKLGKVENVVGLTIESAGPDAKLGDLCRIYTDSEKQNFILAEVVGFKEKKTLLMPYEVTEGIGLGCIVENMNYPLSVQVGDFLLGKTLDGLGRCIDEYQTDVRSIQRYPLEAPPPDPMSREIIDEVLPLGVKAVDGLITVGKGQRIGIFAGSGVGKSTLMNALVGERISIATFKAQTTRHRIMGIYNTDDMQIVFSDTPGVLKPQYKLQESMLNFSTSALTDADVLLYVTDVVETPDKHNEFIEKVARMEIPVLLLINKIDLSNQEKLVELVEAWKALLPNAEIIPISATTKFNVEYVMKRVKELLPDSPPYFDKDQWTDKPARFFVNEIIREKILLYYDKEIPYSVEVVVEQFKEDAKKIHINAVIYVERDSQKGIIIGKQGKALKKVATEARRDLERFFGKTIFLETFVKVDKDWRSSDKELRNFGYQLD